MGEMRTFDHAVGACTAAGLRREENQDRYRMTPNGLVVSDGIGGSSPAGGVMAESACWTIGEMLDTTSLTAEEIVKLANEIICRQGGAISDVCERDARARFFSSPGAAVCVIRYLEDGYELAFRGDVLAFLVSSEKVVQLNHPDLDARNRLTAYLGECDPRIPQRDCIRVNGETVTNSNLVIVSDGIWRFVSLTDIKEICTSSTASPQDMAMSLVERAGQHDSPDDRTALVCRADAGVHADVHPLNR